MHLRACVLLLSFVAIACATPGVPPGNAERGYVVWGFVGQGTSTAAPGQTLALVDASGQVVQTATSSATGKYVFSYHRPGNYAVRVGQLAMPVVIAAEDQRLDIDLSAPGGNMNYAAGAMKNEAKAAGHCGAAPPAPAAGTAGGEQRDPNLAGNWARNDSINSGGDFMSTKLSLLLCADGTYTRKVGDTVGGGAGWHAESGGGGSGTSGRWRTENRIVYIDDGAGGWAPYARYYVEGNQLMLTFDNGKKEVWKR